MSWMAIAKKDFRDARRAKILWGATGVFVFFYAAFLLTASSNDPTEVAIRDAIQPMIFTGAFFLPLVLIAMGYLSMAGERESGSIKYLLGLPNSRRDVLIGKYLGRSALALVAVLLSLAVATTILLVRFGTLTEDFLIYAVLTTYFALMFVAIAVGFSALVATRGKAMAATIGTYFVFGVLWIVPGINPQDSVSFVVEDLLGMGAKPEFYQFIQNLSPVWAYGQAVSSFIYGKPELDSVNRNLHPATTENVFLTDEFMVVIMTAWIVVPLAIGYWRFNRAELG